MINKVILIGNVGKDPDVRHLESGKSVARFSMATSEQYKNREQERVTQTEWHNIVVWSPQAEVVEKYVKKGSRLYIEGKISTRSYEDDNGNKKFFTEIVSRSLQLLDSKRSEESYDSAQSLPPAASPSPGGEEEADDLPF